MKKDLGTIWQTREVKRKNGTINRLMICQNSSPKISKWGEWAPEDGPCDEWVDVASDTTATLCCKCTARTINI